MSGKHDRTDAGAHSRTGDFGLAERGGGTEEAGAGKPDLGPANDGHTAPIEAVARRTPTGWRVGDEEVPDLTSAMVLADLLAAELSAEEQAELDGKITGTGPGAAQAGSQHAATRNAGLISDPRGADPQHAGPPQPGNRRPDDGRPGSAARRGAHRAGGRGAAAQAAAGEIGEAEQLKETVAQLERALTVRVRVEQAIGVLAERHRIRPRQAFELLRSASRARGQRIMETASQVIASATNPLLRLPEELAKPPMPRRMPRRSRGEA
jgi:hypothetical protein